MTSRSLQTRAQFMTGWRLWPDICRRLAILWCSTQRYPSNRSQDFSDQGFFRTLRDHIQTVVIAGSISGAAGNNPGFIVAVRRGRLGSGFRGVIVVKGAPGSFEMFDR